MPRYLGFVWPAFGIATAVLLRRLPTRPLRWSAIALLLAINLAQHGVRIFAGSEPPVDRMAADFVAAKPEDATVAFFYDGFRRFSGEPGMGLLSTPVGRYYICIRSGLPVSPEVLRMGRLGGRGRGRGDDPYYVFRSILPLTMFVPGNVAQRPALQQIVVWDELSPKKIELTDPLGEKLAPAWKRTSEELFVARDHWTWRDLLVCRRRVYERVKP